MLVKTWVVILLIIWVRLICCGDDTSVLVVSLDAFLNYSSASGILPTFLSDTFDCGLWCCSAKRKQVAHFFAVLCRIWKHEKWMKVWFGAVFVVSCCFLLVFLTAISKQLFVCPTQDRRLKKEGLRKMLSAGVAVFESQRKLKSMSGNFRNLGVVVCHYDKWNCRNCFEIVRPHWHQFNAINVGRDRWRIFFSITRLLLTWMTFDCKKARQKPEQLTILRSVSGFKSPRRPPAEEHKRFYFSSKCGLMQTSN